MGLTDSLFLKACRTLSGYVFSVPLIAGCPGLVPGWRAFPAINRVPLPTPRPVLSRPSPVATGLGRERDGRGARWQLRIVAVYRAPSRHKTGAASETLNRYEPGRIRKMSVVEPAVIRECTRKAAAFRKIAKRIPADSYATRFASMV